MGLLDGKVALVTGASRGIGLSIAIELARSGARVALNHHPSIKDEDAAAAAAAIEAAGGTSMHVRADVSVSREARHGVQTVFDEWGRLDILVNNAGITRDKTLRKLSDEDWQEVLDVNLSSVFYCISAAVPIMIDQRFGRIVSISSVVAQTGNFGQANYAAAKAGIIALTKTAALELAKYNITVNAIAPGFTETGMLAGIPQDVRDQIQARVPLGRFAQPEEIARAVRFLASEGDYITGQQINVNGGLYM
ncbi:MAG: beta-ketoacyl-ACP reductase [Chloroflexota bacterium]